MSHRLGDWMITYTGRKFWPLDPLAEEVHIEDIAHALSVICRFGGHTQEFYSVAQHSCLVADLVATKTQDKLTLLTALLHDAAEAYTGDVIRPIKKHQPELVRIEDAVMFAIAQRFWLHRRPICDGHVVIKWADEVILNNEICQLIAAEPGVFELADVPIVSIGRLWSPSQAKHEFLERFNEFSG